MKNLSSEKQQAHQTFWRPLFFSLICGSIGALLNLYPIYLFSDLTLIFGSALSLLVALSLGPWWGALAAAIASTSLIFSWEHYYGYLIFIPEAFIVAHLYRKGWNELFAVLVYWLVISIPFILILVFVRSNPQLAFDLAGKYLMNSFLYTLIASALLWFFSVPSWLQVYPIRTYTLRNQIFTILMVSMTTPIMGILLYNSHQRQSELIEQIQANLQLNSQRIVMGLDRLLNENKLIIQNHAKILALTPNQYLHSEEELAKFHQKHPEFISMLVASVDGVLTAFSPLNAKSKNQNISDRKYFQMASNGQAYISQAFKGRAKGDPIVTISAPIISPETGKVIAILGGSLNLYKFDQLLVDRFRKQNYQQHVILLDSENKVIFNSPDIQLNLLESVSFNVEKTDSRHGFFSLPFFNVPVISGYARLENGWQAISLYSLTEFNQQARDNYRQLGLALLFSVILIGLLAAFLSYQINGPVSWLLKRIDDFSFSRESHKPVVISSLLPKEMVALIRAYESAEKRLKLAFVTEKLHHKKRIHAEKNSEAKSDFLSSMSHELRTPLNAISGFSQLLTLDDSLSSESKELVGEINIASQHLILLINDILDMSKVESGKLQLNMEKVNIIEVIEQSLPLLKNQAQSRQINIEFTQKEERIKVNADPLRLKQVVINLLSNAIKYNRFGGSVKLTLSIKDSQYCCFSVSDTGHGIAAERLDELFEVYCRLDKEDSDIDGHGIGLAISKKLIDLMGGTIEVNSEIGEGSCFCICLPLVNKIQEEEAENTPLKSIQSGLADNDIAPCKVLYIEDNDINAMVMSKALQRFPQIIQAREPSGQAGIRRLSEEYFDFVFLDISLPDMNGFEILEVLKKRLDKQYQYVFAVSANAMSNDVDKGLSAGFNEYVTKPVKFGQLFELIRRYQ